MADTAISGRSGAAGFLPVGSSWSGNTGNMQMVGLDPNFTTANFSLNGVSTLQYTHNGVPFGVILNDVETYQETIGYQFRIGPGSTMTYPAMSIGDTYGYTGSVTYDLTGGMTAGAFTNGSFNNPINGGNFVWSVAVPEPSTYAALFGGIALLVVGCRRLSARRMIQ